MGYLNPFGLGRGFELKVQLARASIAAMHALRDVDPRARFVHCEPLIAIHHDPATGRPGPEAEGWHQAQFQAFDLIAGRAWPQIGGDPSLLDIIGVNYYTNNQWIHGGPAIDLDHPVYRPLSSLLFETFARYGRPIFLSETGVEDDRRAPWFRYVMAEVARARARGVPVEGVCLYTILNHPGWDDDRACQNGLLTQQSCGTQRGTDPVLSAAMAEALAAFPPRGNESRPCELTGEGPESRAEHAGVFHEQHHLSGRTGRSCPGRSVLRRPAVSPALENRASGAMAAPSGVGTAVPYVDWAAIIGGAVVAVALGILFTGFGAALGLTAVSAREGEGSGLAAMVISTIWIVLSMIGAYATGGYVAGRMRRRSETATRDEATVRDGMNGLIVWAVGIVLGAMLLGSAVSGVLTAAGNVAATGAEVAGDAVAGAAEAATGVAAAVAPDDPMGFATGTLLRPQTVQPGIGDPQATMADAASILSNIVATGEISDSDRTYLVQLTAARTGLAPAEVNGRVDQAVAAAQSAREEAARLAAEAEQAARDAAETARISAILTAFLLTATALVGGVASYVAAVRGGRHRDEGRIFGGFAYRG